MKPLVTTIVINETETRFAEPAQIRRIFLLFFKSASKTVFIDFRKREKERERERNSDQLPSPATTTGALPGRTTTLWLIGRTLQPLGNPARTREYFKNDSGQACVWIHRPSRAAAAGLELVQLLSREKA